MSGLVLRDIHAPLAPSWWPPAPGWWWLLAGLLLLIGLLVWRRWRKHRRQRVLEAMFDDAIATANTPSAQVAAMSGLLRRAARRHQPGADALVGEAWLACLNRGDGPHRFEGELGGLLLEGGFRRELDPEAVHRLRQVARIRFLEWMGARA